AIMAGNGPANLQSDARERGTSPELVDSFKQFVLTRMLYPEEVRQIGRLQGEGKTEELGRFGRGRTGIKIEVTDEFVTLIQSFEDVEENNARQVERNVENIFEDPLFEAIVKGYVHASNTIVVDAQKQEDGTYNMVLKVDGVVLDGDPK